MNAVEPAIVEGLPARPEAGVARRHAGLYRIPVYFGCTVLALLINFVLGKDLPWDTLNYHFYAGFEALHNRFQLDYFAAGPQSYFNPYAYLPFYALVRSGLSSLQISSIEALVQSTILWFTYELAITTSSAHSSRRQVAVGLCAVAFALANPILIQQLGSSFADITTGLLVVGGWLLLAQAVKHARLSYIAWGGLIIGTAVALKPTNSVHALAAAVIVLWMPMSVRRRVQCLFAYGAASLAGLVVAGASWAYRLQQNFGNPVFPLMNSVFRSPHFTTERLLNYRFVPTSIGEALWRPFSIVRPFWMTQEEMRAPDLRYALVAVLAAATLIWQLSRISRRPRRRVAPVAKNPVTTAPATRVLAAVSCALLVDWTAWLAASGNGRYFLPMACVTAVVAMELLFRLLGARPKMLGYAVAAVFAIQGTQLALAADFRWNGHPWNEHWLDVDVPPLLAKQPNLYLDIGVQSNSFILPYLAPGSGLTNFSGSYVLSPVGANGARIAALVRRYSPHVRVLTAGDRLYADGDQRMPRRTALDADLAAFNLHIDAGDCQVITVNGLQQDIEVTFAKKGRKSQMVRLLSCQLSSGAAIPTTWAAHKPDAEVVLNRLEEACPRLFGPRGLQTQPFGDQGWMRYYLNTDEMAWVSRGWLKFDDPVSGDGVAYLGRESDWLSGAQRVVCGRRDGHYYAKILKTR